MKNLGLLFILSFWLISNGFAQNTSEKTLIEASIQMYFDGWMTGDTTKVGKVMHSSCKLKLFRDKQFIEISRTDYLSRFKPKAKEAGTEGRIKMIDITGNIASAKCELETPKSVFTDYFNLIKINDFWFIVDKISTRVDKK